MKGTPHVRYDFLQVTDDVLDQRAPALALLLTEAGHKTSAAEALWLVVRLERYALRQVVDEGRVELRAEFEAAATFPDDRAASMVGMATGWPPKHAHTLLSALVDPAVRVMERGEACWRVRALADRYGPYAQRKKSSRERARNNQRAKDAGWEPADGDTWAHRETGEVLSRLKDVISLLDKEKP